MIIAWNFKAVVLSAIVFFVHFISGKELDPSGQTHSERSWASEFYSRSDATESMYDNDIKTAYMQEILHKLGMKHRPPPIPMDKRKPNIPRPVYNGAINHIASSEAERAKQTQIVIAAEEGDDDACEDDGSCFRFRLNHDLLRNHVIDYANLHIYNEAVTQASNGIYKTIHINEILDIQTKQDKEDERQEKPSYSGVNDKDAHDEEAGITIRDKEVIDEYDFGRRKHNPSNIDNSTKKERKALQPNSTSAEDRYKKRESPSQTGSQIKSKTTNAEGVGCTMNAKSQCIDKAGDAKEEKDASDKATVLEEVELLSTKTFLSSKSWFKINLSDVVMKWTQKKRNRTFIHTLKFICKNCKSSLKICSKLRYRPFVVIKITEKKQRRERKRRSYAVNCVPGYKKCCRRKLTVNFKEIKWHDWIIEPASFEVNYCEGRCTGAGVISARTHAYVKQKLMGQKKHTFLTVCCVPVKFSSLTLLHYDDDGLIHKTVFKNMTVEECGCV